jgi:hypothetical protein
MAYTASDPRSKLASTSQPTPTDGFGTASYAKFYETEPQIDGPDEKTWLVRGQHFVLAYSIVGPGAVLARPPSQNEYAVLIPDDLTTLQAAAGDETATIGPRTVSFIPPGPSTLTVTQGGRVVRVFTSGGAPDLAELASNAVAYRQPQPNNAALIPWPDPPEGYRIRSYNLDVAPEPGRFGRIWRCTTIMINYTEPRPGPRDVTKMSPHVHDDFEQASLVLDGSFVHHIRWPWTTNQRHWKPDEHEICAGPSLTVIPPLTVHTSQQVGTGINQLVDIFAPPRFDFSAMDGWVLNASDYPARERT